MTTNRLTLVDVGARGGIHPRWAPYHPLLSVIAFEPDPEECARLNKQQHACRVRYLPVALGASNNEPATLHVTRAPGCSSTLRPNMELVSRFPFGPCMEVVKTYPVTLQRMDSVVDEQPHAMKIDTQGTELHVLQGAGSLLDRTIAVEIEVEFVEQYVGQPLFADVEAFMRSRGFMLRGLRRTFWREHAEHRHSGGGQIMHGDVLYLRPDLLDTPVGHIVLAAYRQYSLLMKFGAQDLVPRASRLRSWVGSLWPNRELRRFVDSLRPAAATDWHDPEFF